MAALFGGGDKVQPTIFSAIQIQTSSQGVPVPVLYGTNRATDNLIWYGGFVATQVSSGGKGGFLANAAGKNSGNYHYSASVIMGVGEGPLLGFGQVWASKTPTSLAELGLTLFLGTYPQAAWSFLTFFNPTQARPYTGLAYLASATYQLGDSAEMPTHTFEAYGFFSSRVVYTDTVIPGGLHQVTVGGRLWSNGTTQSLWVSDVGVAGYTKVGGAPGAGQYSVAAGVYTFNVANVGAAIEIAWNGVGQDADPSLVVADMLTNVNYGAGFPSTRVGELNAYSDNHAVPGSPYQVSVTNAANFDDNQCVAEVSTGALFTCVAASPGPLQYTYTTGGLYTFNSADSGKTLAIAYSALDPLTKFQNYCWSAGFFISPAYITQTSTGSLLDDIAKFCNSEIVWSAGAMKIVPRGDKTITGNGHTYTAPSATVADLTDDQFMVAGAGTGGSGGSNSDDPVLITRKRTSDADNVVQVEALDRSNQYNAAIIDATDQASVDQFGRRSSGSISAHMFTDTSIARTAAQLMLQREAIRNTAGFSLDARWVWLDPMDIVSLADAALGLDASTWWRMTDMEEQDDGSLVCLAEEYAQGASHSAAYSFGVGSGFAANYNVDPGSVNVPTIFEPSVQLATNTGLETWSAVSGASPNWGGCDVWVSADNVTYNFRGRKYGASRMGLLTADFPVHADPDTASVVSVNLTESFGALVSGTTSDADLGNTVCLVDAEMFSFETAQLTGAYNYNLKDYLRRGQFGTAIADHPIGSPFARLDDTIFPVPYDKDQIGQTIYVKFASFNLYGGGLQDISVATAYPHVIVGPPLPGVVQDFAITQQGGPVIFTWTDLPDFVLKGYDILYSDPAVGIGSAIFLTEASRATEMTHANVPPGAWTFYIRGHDLADQVGPATTLSFTVRNFNFLISEQNNEPDWFGTLTSLVKHVSGVLVPQGQFASNTYGWQVFDSFVPDPIVANSYVTPEIDTLADGQMRIFVADAVLPATAYGEAGLPANTAQIKWKTSSGAYNAFQDWVSGIITARYVTGRLVLDTAVRSYMSVFDITADSPPATETFSATIDPAGTTVFWPTPFRNTPNVQVTPGAAGATSGTATTITVNSAFIQLWNGAAEVGGTAMIAATGV